MQRWSGVSGAMRSSASAGLKVAGVRTVQLSARTMEDFEKHRVAFDPPANLPAPSDEPLTAPVAKLTKLGNGVRVASLFSKTPVASLAVFYDAGSRFDTADAAGASYLLGRLGYSGTHAPQAYDSLEK